LTKAIESEHTQVGSA